MKKLSLNIKKIALSLLVVGLAVGFSAFTNTENSSRFLKTYYHLGSNYVVAASVPVGYSCKTDTQPCRITFTTANQPDDDLPISESNLSSYTYIPSGTGSYQP
jgi:hypothetical protein